MQRIFFAVKERRVTRFRWNLAGFGLFTLPAAHPLFFNCPWRSIVGKPAGLYAET